jgi:hypothetical protein
MAYLTTLTLDDLDRPATMQHRLAATGRLDDMDRRVVRGFLTTLSEYLRDRGTGTRFEYTVTDSDFDNVVDLFKQGLPK